MTIDITHSGITPDLGAAARANDLLHNGKGAGNDFLGWVGLPSYIGDLDAIIREAERLRVLGTVISVGIGGSYLGAKSVIEALSNPFAPADVLFAGQNLSEDYTQELLDALTGRDFSVVVISKSGTTTEPAVAFRLLRAELEKRYGTGAKERIVAVTDRARGALKTMADREGWPTFVIPDNVGGRYSVFTPAGLLTIACAGIDIKELIAGAHEMEQLCKTDGGPAATYAATRNVLYAEGKKIEILAAYEPKLQYIAEWWKQLFGESEGKKGHGIFPASVNYTADLHSMGQYIQDGERILFETVLSIAQPASRVVVERDPDDLDELNFVAGRRLSDINHKAEEGVRMAHVDGGVPNIRIELSRIDARNIGALLYFFEKACGISGYMLGVNPFDQPGVEDYKRNMFKLLGKPGY